MCLICRSRVDRRVKGVQWRLLLDNFASNASAAEDEAMMELRSAQPVNWEEVLPASLDSGRDADPHFQKVNKAVLRHLSALSGQPKVMFRVSAPNLCRSVCTLNCPCDAHVDQDDLVEFLRRYLDVRAQQATDAQPPDPNPDPDPSAMPDVDPQVLEDPEEALPPPSPNSQINASDSSALVIQRAWRQRLLDIETQRVAHAQREQNLKRESAAKRIQREVRERAQRRQHKIEQVYPLVPQLCRRLVALA